MTIADYTVLMDGSFNLSAGQVNRLNFDLPDSFVAGTFRAKPILMYNIIPLSSVRYIAAVNAPAFEDPPADLIREEESLGERTFRSLHEAINGNVFRSGSNTIDFRVLSGRARFTDVVLLFQRRDIQGD